MKALRELANVASSCELPLFIGIDPGASGAIAFIVGSPAGKIRTEALDIPTFKVSRGRKKKTVPDYQGILKIFSVLRDNDVSWRQVQVCLEQPPPSMGPGRQYAEASLQAAYAIWPLFILSKRYGLTEVAPSKWKKEMKVSKQKDDVRHLAQKMFPGVSLARKKDHNRAEALLLAEYLRRKASG